MNSMLLSKDLPLAVKLQLALQLNSNEFNKDFIDFFNNAHAQPDSNSINSQIEEENSSARKIDNNDHSAIKDKERLSEAEEEEDEDEEDWNKENEGGISDSNNNNIINNLIKEDADDDEKPFLKKSVKNSKFPVKTWKTAKDIIREKSEKKDFEKSEHFTSLNEDEKFLHRIKNCPWLFIYPFEKVTYSLFPMLSINEEKCE